LVFGNIQVPGNVPLKKTITSYPTLFGALIALLLCGAIFAITIWAPWIWDHLGRHKTLVQAIYFTAFFFAACVYGFWRWRRRGAFAFWASMSILFVLHALGVFLYSTLVQPIGVWQWTILGLLECYTAAFFLYWSTRRFGHANMRRHSRLRSGQEPPHSKGDR